MGGSGWPLDVMIHVQGLLVVVTYECMDTCVQQAWYRPCDCKSIHIYAWNISMIIVKHRAYYIFTYADPDRASRSIRAGNVFMVACWVATGLSFQVVDWSTWSCDVCVDVFHKDWTCLICSLHAHSSQVAAGAASTRLCWGLATGYSLRLQNSDRVLIPVVR